MSRWSLPLLLLLAFLLITPLAAQAGGDEMELLRAQLEAMQQQMAQMAERLAEMEQKLAAAEERAAAPPAARLDTLEQQVADAGQKAESAAAAVAEVEEKTASDVKVSVADGHLKIASNDGRFEVEAGGRLQFDAAFFNSDDSSFGNGSEVRRARLYLAGKVFDDWYFKNEIDFAGDTVAIKDAYLRYAGLPAAITIGNFKEPFSLEELTSSRFTTFMERALPNVFAPSRNLGIGANLNGATEDGKSMAWSAALGVFGQGVDDRGVDIDTQREDDEGVGVTGRFTLAPVASGDRLLHFGAALGYRDTGDNKTLRLRERIEAHIADRRLVDTGNIDGVSSLFRVGAEASAAYGPFALQGEYIRTSLDRDLLPDPTFSGYYVYGSWFLTGESRAASYRKSAGTFDRLKPASPLGSGIGAFELALRFSHLDLSDDGIDGGEEDNLTVGLNWYPVSHVRLMANYVKVLDVDGGPNAGDEPDAFQLRAQVDF